MKKLFTLFIISFMLMSCSAKNSVMPAYQNESVSKDMSIEERTNEKSYIDELKRMVIHSVDIRIKSEKMSDTKKNIISEIEKQEGYVKNTSEYYREDGKGLYKIYMQVRIPSDKLNAFVSYIEENTQMYSKELYSTDVTDTVFDMENRIKNRETLLTTLRGYLLKAKNIDEIMKVEEKISSATAELENMKGSLKNIENKVSYSEVNIDLTNPNFVKSYGSDNNFFRGIKNTFSNIASFLYNFIFAALYISVIGGVLVLSIALIYYIGFGKIGLIKKLFNKIK